MFLNYLQCYGFNVEEAGRFAKRNFKDTRLAPWDDWENAKRGHRVSLDKIFFQRVLTNQRNEIE